MIHNPFLPDENDGEPSELVKAFTAQIETIYRKRFGLSHEKSGPSWTRCRAGRDILRCGGSVKAGIIPESHVLRTSKQLRDKVRADLSGITDAAAIQAVMNRITPPEDENHPSGEKTTILNTKLNQRPMNEEKTLSPEYSAVIASLGMQEKNEVKDVLSRISELTGVEARLAEANKALSDAKTVIAGKDAAIGNLQKDLDSVTARLQVYEQKEADAKASAIENSCRKPWTKAR